MSKDRDHGHDTHGATTIRAADLTLDRFIDPAELDAATVALPPVGGSPGRPPKYRLIGRSTTHVVLLRDTPWAAADVPDCLSAHLTTPAACAFPRDARSHLDASLAGAERTAIAAAADDGAWVRSVDPTRLVCPRSTCSVVTPKGVIVYRDGHHLTRTYSAGLAKPFANLLAPSLR